MYLSLYEVIGSAILVREENEKHILVYFINHFSISLEHNSFENLILALIRASRTLRPYFDVHSIMVSIDSTKRDYA